MRWGRFFETPHGVEIRTGNYPFQGSQLSRPYPANRAAISARSNVWNLQNGQRLFLAGRGERGWQSISRLAATRQEGRLDPT
jgi:hypothetical protein